MKNQTEVRDALTKAFDQCNIRIPKPDQSLRDTGIDSLDLFLVYMTVEEILRIEIPEEHLSTHLLNDPFSKVIEEIRKQT